MATIQVRVPDTLKKDVEKILESLGLDITSAVRMFLNRVQTEQGIPFPISLRRNLIICESPSKSEQK